MNIQLDREGLKTLVKGSTPSYFAFDNPLVIKAGHDYRDQYGTTTWRKLDNLTDEELYQLYLVCRNSRD
jgi:hypothetical protein